MPTLRTVQALYDHGLIDAGAVDELRPVEAQYAIAVTDIMARAIGDRDDPIGRQFIPHRDETILAPFEIGDPTGDAAFSPVRGVVHRYPDRALLKPLLICPVYCRFCFRREQVGPDGGLLTEAELEEAFAYLAAQPGLREVILTGGDPLMLSPRRLAAILRRLAAMPQIEILRLHTRVPLVAPDRVTAELTAALQVDKPVWIAIHANHAREFTEAGQAALARLARAALPLLGQSVLLQGVNDTEAALEALWRTMLRHRVKPYYLHQLDPAPGTARFAVPIARGLDLLRALRGRLSGPGLPTYVLDIAGGHGKVPLGPDYWDGENRLRDPWGEPHMLALPREGG